jgi:uncharacterized protein YecE (DUF72 family)
MEFGKVSNENGELDRIDWTIPKDDARSIAFLNASLAREPKAQAFEIFHGSPAWAHKDWIGKIYPEKTKSTDYLYWYSRYFRCIELNTTHYRIPSSETVLKWKEPADSEFRFCPKVYKGISHERGGLLDRALLSEWFRFMDDLGESAGPAFLQLPPYFDYSMKRELFHFLQSWPERHRLALEFRHPSWFSEGAILPALTEYLQSRRIGLVMTDVAGRRDVLHTSLSAEFTMLRFIGNELHASDRLRAWAWAERFSHWREAGLQAVYLFIHEPEDTLTPEMTEIFREELRSVGGNGFELRGSSLHQNRLF